MDRITDHRQTELTLFQQRPQTRHGEGFALEFILGFRVVHRIRSHAGIDEPFRIGEISPILFFLFEEFAVREQIAVVSRKSVFLYEREIRFNGNPWPPALMFQGGKLLAAVP